MVSFIEVFKDFMFLDSILQFKKNLNNIHSKNLFSGILLTMLPVVSEEFIQFVHGSQKIHRSNFFNSEAASDLIYTLRQHSLKTNASISSRSIGAIKTMGINFDDNVYDLNITIDQNLILHDMNFESYVMSFDENLPAQEALILMMRTYLNIFLDSYGLTYEEFLQDSAVSGFYNDQANSFEEIYNLSKYSYSTNLLFNNSKGKRLTEKDKKFILFNYRFLNSYFIFPKDISYSIEIGEKKIDLSDSLYKYFAINIEKIGQELMKMKTHFSIELLHTINNEITDLDFYPLNRKLRNNIHYKEISEISITDFDSIKTNQYIFINTCIDYIKTYLNIDLNEEVLLMTQYTSIASENSIPFEELINNHEEYYISFLKTGAIKRK